MSVTVIDSSTKPRSASSGDINCTTARVIRTPALLAAPNGTTNDFHPPRLEALQLLNVSANVKFPVIHRRSNFNLLHLMVMASRGRVPRSGANSGLSPRLHRVQNDADLPAAPPEKTGDRARPHYRDAHGAPVRRSGKTHQGAAVRIGFDMKTVRTHPRQSHVARLGAIAQVQHTAAGRPGVAGAGRRGIEPDDIDHVPCVEAVDHLPGAIAGFNASD